MDRIVLALQPEQHLWQPLEAVAPRGVEPQEQVAAQLPRVVPSQAMVVFLFQLQLPLAALVEPARHQQQAATLATPAMVPQLAEMALAPVAQAAIPWHLVQVLLEVQAHQQQVMQQPAQELVA